MRVPTVVIPAVLVLGAAFVVAGPAPRAADPERLYHVAKRWQIGGEGGWDDLAADTASRRLYVSHGTRVEVRDLDRGDSLATIAPTPGVHGIALAPDLDLGFISCGRDSSVVAFDLASSSLKLRIPVGARNPDAILYEPVTHRVLVMNGGSASATVLEARNGAIVGTIALGGRPEFAVADGRGKVFVNIEDTSELVRLDAKSLKVEARWPLAPGEGPSGLAMDRARRRLFSVCGNRTMVVMDADRGSVIASLPIGSGVDGVAFDPDRGLASASNGEGTLTVVREASPGRFEVAETDTTERGARTVTLDERTGTLYLTTASFGPPPEPTAERPHPRGAILPGTFRVLVLEP
jgi:DNA-binding beta-propeller fold protein YncE